MPWTTNRHVLQWFNRNQWRVFASLFVIYWKLAWKRAMGASILSWSIHKGVSALWLILTYISIQQSFSGYISCPFNSLIICYNCLDPWWEANHLLLQNDLSWGAPCDNFELIIDVSSVFINDRNRLILKCKSCFIVPKRNNVLCKFKLQQLHLIIYLLWDAEVELVMTKEKHLFWKSVFCTLTVYKIL